MTLHKELAAGLSSNQEQNSSSTHLAPTSYFDLEKMPGSPDSDGHEYDPTVNPKPCSPFYNHDLPRPSSDRPKNSITQSRVQVIHVTASSEPQSTCTATAKSSFDIEKGGVRKDADGRLKLWPGRLNRILGLQKSPKKKSMIRPRRKTCGCLAGLTKGQRLMVKLLIAVLIVGAMVAVGIGITKGVGGGVYKTNNQTTRIGRSLAS